MAPCYQYRLALGQITKYVFIIAYDFSGWAIQCRQLFMLAIRIGPMRNARSFNLPPMLVDKSPGIIQLACSIGYFLQPSDRLGGLGADGPRTHHGRNHYTN